MPAIILWSLGSFVVGSASGFIISSDTKKLLIYAGVGFVAYQLAVK